MGLRKLIIVGTNRLYMIIKEFIMQERQAEVVTFSTCKSFINEEVLVIPFEGIVKSIDNK